MKVYHMLFQLYVQQSVCETHHFGLERRLHLPSLQRRPVDALEERVQPDVTHDAEPARGVSLEQLPGKKEGEASGTHDISSLISLSADICLFF